MICKWSFYNFRNDISQYKYRNKRFTASFQIYLLTIASATRFANFIIFVIFFFFDRFNLKERTVGLSFSLLTYTKKDSNQRHNNTIINTFKYADISFM